MKRMKYYSMLFCMFLSTWTLAQPDPKPSQLEEVKKEVERIVSIEIGDDEFAEGGVGNYVLKEFLKKGEKDIFYFFTTSGLGGGNNTNNYLSIFSPEDGEYKLIAYGQVATNPEAIDYGFVDIMEEDIVLRTDSWIDIMNEQNYGVRTIYFKWRLDKGKLVGDGKPLMLKNGELVPASRLDSASSGENRQPH